MKTSKARNFVIIRIHSETHLPSSLRNSLEKSGVSAALGNFDGLHRGHVEILKRVVQRARHDGSIPTLISFYPHPARVLGRSERVLNIYNMRDSASSLQQQGIELFVQIHFTQSVSQLSYQDFLSSYLMDRLFLRHLVVGEDATVGKNREGNTNCMRSFFCEYPQVSLEVVPFVEWNGKKIGSRAIRSAIQAAHFEEGAQLLGREWSLSRRVIKGERRGRTIGIPTANCLPGGIIQPDIGVYATWSNIRGSWYPSVTNIGVAPTFHRNERRIETHLLGYNGDEFYGERLRLVFRSRLRGEHTFAGVEELKKQIEIDISQASSLLGHPPNIEEPL